MLEGDILQRLFTQTKWNHFYFLIEGKSSVFFGISRLVSFKLTLHAFSPFCFAHIFEIFHTVMTSLIHMPFDVILQSSILLSSKLYRGHPKNCFSLVKPFYCALECNSTTGFCSWIDSFYYIYICFQLLK